MSRKSASVLLILALGISFLSGCGTVARKPSKPLDNVAVYKGAYEKVWLTAIDVLINLGFPIIHSERRDGIITSDWMEFKRHSFSLGIKSWRERTNNEKTQVTLRILAAENGTEVKVRVYNEDFVGAKGMLWKSHWMKTYTNGKLEKDILKKISLGLIGEKVKLSVTAEPGQLNPDGKSVSAVTASLIDENGNVIITGKGKVMFAVTGPVKLTGKNPAQMVNGIAVTKIKSTKVSGSVEVLAAFKELTSEPFRMLSGQPEQTEGAIEGISEEGVAEPATTEQGTTGEENTPEQGTESQ
jgi:hypothetical protein